MNIAAVKMISLALFCLMASVPSQALVTRGGALGTGPISLGQGGAVVAGGNPTEASFWNPAALSELKSWSASVLGGTGQIEGLYHSGFAFASPAADYGTFGLSLVDTRFTKSADFRQTQITASGAVPLTKNVWLGSNQRLITAGPGGLRGWSMDVGAIAAVDMPWKIKGYRQQLFIGASVLDMVSSLRWGNGLEELQPLVAQIGASYAITDSVRLSAQLDQLDSLDSGSRSQWRAGGQWSLFNHRLTLRAGATRLEGAQVHVSAGLGGAFVRGRLETRFDYAVVVPSDDLGTLGNQTRHLLSVSVGFVPKNKKPARAAFTKVLRDKKNRIHSAKIGLASVEGADVEEWELTITDEDGTPLRTFKGKGALPADLAWNGRNDDGDLVEADSLQYDLRTTNGSGKVMQRRSILAAVSAGGDRLGDIEDLSDEDAALRSVTAAASPMRVKPSLRQGDGYELAGADFDLSDVSTEDVEAWELRVVDSEGKVVKTFSGKGKPPKSIQWEGNSDLGEPIEGGLGGGYELRVVEKGGAEKKFASDLVQEKDFAQLAQGAAAAAVVASKAPRGPKMDCRRDVFGRGWICFVPFASGEEGLGAEGVRQLENIARLIKEGAYVSIVIHGHTDNVGDPEKNMTLSQVRADSVMDMLLATFKIKVKAIQAVGMGDTQPLVKANTKEGRKINRRVEVHLRPDLVD